MENIVFFLPTRKGSERVINKNTRQFAGVDGGILRVKIKQLLEIANIPIIISTNDPETIKVASSFNSSRIVIIERPERLCLSSTIIEDFIDYIPTVVSAEHICWVHVTAPFVGKSIYEDAIKKYFSILKESKYDSLLSVNKIQQFLWDEETGEVVNHDRSTVKWPRTQDLKPLYEINHAFYLNSRQNYLDMHDRIGKRPYLFELNKLASFDIDWDDDFKIAELLYEAIGKI
ncbi:acylneuraminate cytidylyltransferase family protein [Sphingobacterium multivorum]|uniref:acylneuraminate cytidylyltransferase family protein n=1 Tax=Sphingobacterium multivorum TaxID=28454 RepID=UPI0028AA5D66|nr:acylneuraminate cytidylyltransferase family protein [Sphingobacterium multivorum]